MEGTGRKVLEIKEGNYKQMGIWAYHQGYQVTIALQDVKKLILCLFDIRTKEKVEEINLPLKYRKGRLYSFFISGVDLTAYLYQFQVNEKVFPDPYARALAGREVYGQHHEVNRIYGVVYQEDYDWEEDRFPELPTHEMFMYKLHVRGFTKHRNSKVKHKGTFLGVAEKIPYLKELGVTTIELMPAYEFEELMERESNYKPAYQHEEVEEQQVLNYWGYGKGDYYTPKYSYGATKHPQREFKDMVKAFHKENMEVVMEFYFDSSKSQGFVVDCVKYWVEEYHIDGVHLYGKSLPTALLAREPILSGIKIFQDHQDTSQVYESREPLEYRNLIEYNDGFLNCGRSFLKSDGNQVSDFAYRIRKNEAQQAVVNYMANNNGFTLYDGVCYEKKHNEANGEGNKDGTNQNYTWNCGVEGETRKKKVLEFRKKQLKNALAFVFLSQGIPLLMSGDECCNSQQGNNNAYCQDNEISWLSWKQGKLQTEIFEYVKFLVKLRKCHPILSGKARLRVLDYLACGYPDVSYHSERAWTPYFDSDSRYLGVMYCGNYACVDRLHSDDYFYVAYNMHWESHALALPNLPKGKKWAYVFSTTQDNLSVELLEQSQELLEVQKSIPMEPRSITVLKSVDVREKKRNKSKGSNRVSSEKKPDKG